MSQAVHFAVLRELGVLFEAPHATNAAPEATGDHALFPHTPLWAYENPECARPFADASLPALYAELPPGGAPDEVAALTRFVVFLGAADTPTFRAFLAKRNVLLVIIEPDAGRLARFAASVPAPLLAKRAVILLGELEAFNPPVSSLLPPKLFSFGFPAVYALPDYDPETARQAAELVELLFYRHRLYRLSGQAMFWGLPVRDIVRGLFYDQQLHSYANVADYLRRPDIRPLRKAFAGETAVLVAAGPELPDRLEFIRRAKPNAVVIAVNNALKPLLAGGVAPHFVVANDTSVLTANSYADLPPLPETLLVSHCLADLGGAVFPRKFLFGSYMPELFGQRANLRLHGSVLTTAYALARHLGCARCVLIGAQLCSDNPWSLSYSRGSIHESQGRTPGRPLTNAWPQLVPVPDRGGRTRYTTLNFLDAARWLSEEIASAGVPCVALTDQTLLRGPLVSVETDPVIAPTGRLDHALGLAARAADIPPKVKREPVAAFLRSELKIWTAVGEGVRAILSRQGDDFVAASLLIMEQFDKNNVSYLVQRFGGFDSRRFHAAVFGPEAGRDRQWGLRHYMKRVAGMAEVFTGVLREQLEAF